MWENWKSICEINTGNGIIMHMCKDDKKQTKTTERTEEYKQVAISDCISKLMYKLVAIGKVMSAVPYMSGFILRFAVFFTNIPKMYTKSTYVGCDIIVN